MATESTTENNGSTTETVDQEQQGQQQQNSTSETGANGEQQQAAPNKTDEPIKLPDDHPLVKSLAAQKATLASQKAEIAELRTKSLQVTKLEDELKARPSSEALETLQTRYDRLEGFLQAVGGPLSKALDSRTFTRDLFETDTKISDIIAKFERDNPSATSVALGKGSQTGSGTGKIDPNELIRIARGK